MQGGTNIEVSGSGTVDDPYVISGSGIDVSDAITFADTDTVNFTVTGAGTDTDPWTVRADATVGVADLTDVTCASPAANDVLTWDGTSWVCAPVSADPGAITTANGARGDGTVATPIEVDTVAAFGTPPLDVYDHPANQGVPVYVAGDNHLYTPGTEGPLILSGATVSSGAVPGLELLDATMPAENYMAFTRFGSVFQVYSGRIGFVPTNNPGSGNIRNVQLLQLPFAPAWNGLGVTGFAGPVWVYTISNSGILNAVATKSPIDPGSGFPADHAASFSAIGIMDPRFDPYEAFAGIRANAEPDSVVQFLAEHPNHPMAAYEWELARQSRADEIDTSNDPDELLLDVEV